MIRQVGKCQFLKFMNFRVVPAPLSDYRERHTKAEIASRKKTREVLSKLIGDLPQVEIVKEGKITYFKLVDRDQIQSNVVSARSEEEEPKGDSNCIDQEGSESSIEFYTDSAYSLLGYSLAHGDLNDGLQV